MLYISLIESHINYCRLLWGTNYDKIFKLNIYIYIKWRNHLKLTQVFCLNQLTC